MLFIITYLKFKFNWMHVLLFANSGNSTYGPNFQEVI